MPAVVDAPRTSQRIKQCPACSETLQDRGEISVCINCSTGYSDPPEFIPTVSSVQPPRVVDDRNVVKLKGCDNCGSAYVGDVCDCGACRNRDLGPDYVVTAEAPQKIAAHADRVCVECRVPRDLIGTRLVCPLCASAKALPDDVVVTAQSVLTLTPKPQPIPVPSANQHSQQNQPSRKRR